MFFRQFKFPSVMDSKSTPLEIPSVGPSVGSNYHHSHSSKVQSNQRREFVCSPPSNVQLALHFHRLYHSNQILPQKRPLTPTSTNHQFESNDFHENMFYDDDVDFDNGDIGIINPAPTDSESSSSTSSSSSSSSSSSQSLRTEQSPSETIDSNYDRETLYLKDGYCAYNSGPTISVTDEVRGTWHFIMIQSAVIRATLQLTVYSSCFNVVSSQTVMCSYIAHILLPFFYSGSDIQVLFSSPVGEFFRWMCWSTSVKMPQVKFDMCLLRLWDISSLLRILYFVWSSPQRPSLLGQMGWVFMDSIDCN